MHELDTLALIMPTADANVRQDVGSSRHATNVAAKPIQQGMWINVKITAYLQMLNNTTILISAVAKRQTKNSASLMVASVKRMLPIGKIFWTSSCKT